MRQRLFKLTTILVLLSIPSTLFALCPDGSTLCNLAVSCEDEPDNPNCVPADTELPVYCDNDETATFVLGLDDNFDLEFTVRFADKAPAKKLKFYVVDGNDTGGKANEAKVADLSCGAAESGSGQDCVGGISIERAEELESDFDFDQSVINFVTRKGKKNVCLGKFTNDATRLSGNGLLERSYCTFIPSSTNTDASGLSGSGFFDPKGYGTQGDAEFFLTLVGFPTDKELKGCIPVSDTKYQEALSFVSYEATATDEGIYRNLSDEEQAFFENKKDLLSYDLARAASATSGDFSASFGSSPLSQIGRQVSAPSASRERSSSNKSSSKNSNRNKKRKKRKKNKRGSKASSLALFDIAAKSKKVKAQRTQEWLAFDPLGNTTVRLSPNCKGDVLEKSYGTLVCGADNPDTDARKCIDLTTTASADGPAGKACLEPREGYDYLLVRATALAAGEYYVCVDGTALAQTLSVSSVSSGTFGEIQAADSSTISDAVESIVPYTGDLSAAGEISISSASDCSSPALQGSFN